MNRKQLALVVASTAVACALVAAALFTGGLTSSDERLKVVASFYPLAYFAEEIGGEKAKVDVLIPENAEPHAWEPSTSDILKVDKADVFIYNGGGFEPWIGNFLDSAHNGALTVVDTSAGIAISGDPHFWLDPLSAKLQVDNILAGFSSADPGNAGLYEANAQALKGRLDKLNQDYVDGLAGRLKNDIVTTHEGFDYMANRYGFNAHAAIGISADEQPSVQAIADLVDIVHGLGIHYVFVEPVYSDQYMETIAAETGAQTLVLDGIHGRTGVHSGMDYFEIMYANLEQLRIGLEAPGV
ncbi:MAG: zinc ABC transporter substrate-binding protein [Methanobacteriota archaeon]